MATTLAGLEPVDSDDLEVIAGGLAKLTPVVLSAIRRVGIVDYRKSATPVNILALTSASELILDASLVRQHRNETERVVVHEATHAFTNLCGSARAATGVASQWPAEVVTAASAVLDRNRLFVQLTKLWRELHSSGFESHLTLPYVDPGANDDSPENDVPPTHAWAGVEDPAAGGWATKYGASNAKEDIADYVSTTTSATWVEPGICSRFLAESTLPPTLAIPYAKLAVLRGLGAISETAFDRCVRNATLGNAHPGITFEGQAAAFTDEPAGFVASDEAGPVFRVRALGVKDYGFVIEVRLDTPKQSPLGLHRVDRVLSDFFKIAAPSSAGLYLANTRDPFLARVGSRGLVLVTEASEQRVEGALFGVVLENALGGVTDVWPFGRFSVRR